MRDFWRSGLDLRIGKEGVVGVAREGQVVCLGLAFLVEARRCPMASRFIPFGWFCSLRPVLTSLDYCAFWEHGMRVAVQLEDWSG